jgi:hypothetical protein
MMLYKAYRVIIYIWNRFTYYLETKGDYNSFLEKVNELKSDPKVQTYAHVIENYDIRKIAEIQFLQEKFSSVYGKRERPQEGADVKNLNNYLEHITACLKHSVYLKLFDKITSPLMKGDYLLKLLNELYPEGGNEDKVKQLKEFRKNLRNKSFKFIRDDLDNIEQIQSYLQKIVEGMSAFNNHYYNLKDSSSIIPAQLSQYKINTTSGAAESKELQERRKTYVELQQSRANSACENDLKELEILEQRGNIKLSKEAADYIVSPFCGGSSKAVKNKQGLSEEEKAINSVITVAGQVKNDLENNIKPFTTQDIISPDTKFLNPIAQLFCEKEYEHGSVNFASRGR